MLCIQWIFCCSKRGNGGGGRVPAPAVHDTKGKKAGEHE